MGFTTLMAVAHKFCALEYDEMLGDGRLGDSGAAGQGVDGLLAIAREPLEDCPAGGVGKGFEDVICYGRHNQNHNQMVMGCQDGFAKMILSYRL